MSKGESKGKTSKKVVENAKEVSSLASIHNPIPVAVSNKKRPTQLTTKTLDVSVGFPKIEDTSSFMDEDGEKNEELENRDEDEEDQIFEEEDDEEETEESNAEEQTEEEKDFESKNAEYLASIRKILASQTKKMVETHPIAQQISKKGILLTNEQINSWAIGVQKLVQNILESNLELDHSTKNTEVATQVTASDIFSSYKFSMGSKEKCLWHVEYAKTALKRIESMNEKSS